MNLRQGEAMFAQRWIDILERRSGEDLTYAREIARESPAGFWKLALMYPAIGHKGVVSAEMRHVARLGTLLREDCGPCVQVQLNEAIHDGISFNVLERVIKDPASLDVGLRDAYEFGRGVAASPGPDRATHDRLVSAVGRRGVVDLAVASASVRIFPALKRGLGFSQRCTPVRMGLE